MQHRLELSKLAELRAKTDRQLVALINRRLDAGLGSALQLGKTTVNWKQRTLRFLHLCPASTISSL